MEIKSGVQLDPPLVHCLLPLQSRELSYIWILIVQCLICPYWTTSPDVSSTDVFDMQSLLTHHCYPCRQAAAAPNCILCHAGFMICTLISLGFGYIAGQFDHKWQQEWILPGNCEFSARLPAFPWRATAQLETASNCET